MALLHAAPHIVASALGAGWRRFDGPAVVRVAEGQALVRGGDELLRAGRGDLVCVPRGVGCELRRLGGAARLEQLGVDPAWAERALELAAWSDRDGDGAGSPAFRVDRSGTDRARHAARLMREIEQADPDDDGGALRLAARCVELLGLVVTPPAGACATGEAARGLGRRERFLRAVEALRGDSFEEISLPAFARRAGLSERHASRLFQLELGKTFREHLAELRLERAKALLRDTEMTVIEVAAETGWSSLAHFNAVFRRRVGSTPSQFRICQAPPEPVRIAS
jgi:AraC-like DNA-binding protein